MSRLRALLHLLILAVLGILPWMAWREHHSGATAPRPEASPRVTRPSPASVHPAPPRPGETGIATSTSSSQLEITPVQAAPTLREPLPAACSATNSTSGERVPGCPGAP